MIELCQRAYFFVIHENVYRAAHTSGWSKSVRTLVLLQLIYGSGFQYGHGAMQAGYTMMLML